MNDEEKIKKFNEMKAEHDPAWMAPWRWKRAEGGYDARHHCTDSIYTHVLSDGRELRIVQGASAIRTYSIS